MTPRRTRLLPWAAVVAVPLLAIALAYIIPALRPPSFDMPSTTCLVSSAAAPLRLLSRSLQQFRPAALFPQSHTSSQPTASSSASIVSSNSNTPQQRRPFTSSPAAKMGYDTDALKQAIEHRRTIYALQKKSSVPDAKIKEMVETAIKNVPSSFNSQSSRLVVLVKDEHDKFWQVVTDILKAHVPEDAWEHTAQRMGMFQGAYGTILFYEDPEPVKALQSKFAQYADKFPVWAEHTSAMHQFALWTALEAEGLGCNLQHYNPLPDQKASEIWSVPLEWSLKAQLVFGEPAEGAREKLAEKQQQPLEKRVFFHGM